MPKSKEEVKVTSRARKPKEAPERVARKVYNDSMMCDTRLNLNFYGEVVGFWRD